MVSTTKARPEESVGRPRTSETMYETARPLDEGSAGLAVGVQVVAAQGREDRVLAVMQALAPEQKPSGTW